MAEQGNNAPKKSLIDRLFDDGKGTIAAIAISGALMVAGNNAASSITFARGASKRITDNDAGLIHQIVQVDGGLEAGAGGGGMQVQWVAEQVQNLPGSNMSVDEVQRAFSGQQLVKQAGKRAGLEVDDSYHKLLVQAVTQDAVRKGLESGRLREVNDDTGCLLAAATEKFASVRTQMQNYNPRARVRILVDTQDNTQGTNLIITPKGKGENFLVFSEGLYSKIEKYREQPVGWVAEVVQNYRFLNGRNPDLSDERILGKIPRRDLQGAVTQASIKAGLASGRLIEITGGADNIEDRLHPQAHASYENMMLRLAPEQYKHIKDVVDLTKPKNPIRVFVDTRDNDGAAKMNFIVTPPGHGENFLIISEGAHKWDRDYVRQHKTLHQLQLMDEVLAGNLEMVFPGQKIPKKLDGNMRSIEAEIAKSHSPELAREVIKIAQMEGLEYVPTVYVQKNDAPGSPPKAVLGGMIGIDGQERTYLIMNETARDRYRSAITAHELAHTPHVEAGAIADVHNLPDKQRLEARFAQETVGDLEAQRLGFGQEMKAAIHAAEPDVKTAQRPGVQSTRAALADADDDTHPSVGARDAAIDAAELKAKGSLPVPPHKKTPVADAVSKILNRGPKEGGQKWGESPEIQNKGGKRETPGS